MTELPEGWEELRTDEAGDIDLGRQRSPKYHDGPNMKPYLRVANVFEDRIDASDLKDMHFEPEQFERFRLLPGEILLNEGQSPEWLGRPTIYRGDPPDVAFTNSLIRFRSGSAVMPDWALVVFRHHMHSGRFAREARITTNIAHLSASRLAAVEFRVPPMPEQQRIVAAIEEAFSKLDAGETALRNARRLLQRMRDAVLAAAVTGHLVPQDPTDTPATELLANLGVEPLGQDDLPVGWSDCLLGSVTELQEYGLSLKAHEQPTDCDVPILRMGNIRQGRIDSRSLKYLGRHEEGVSERMLVDGDLLFNRTNSFELVGKTAVYRRNPPEATFASYLIRVRTRGGIAPDWCAAVINSGLGRAYIEEVVAQQVGQANVNGTKLRRFPIPIPPLPEQARIVAEVERLMSFVEAGERAVDAGMERAGALRRSVLKAAFEGRLVAQDPTDEPASVLLERIRAERAATPKPKTRKARAKS